MKVLGLRPPGLNPEVEFMVCSSIGRWRVLAAFILWLTPVVAFAESVTVEWDPSEGATGYTVRWGTALGSYPNTADAGPSTQFTIAGLVPGTMYWAVAQAYNATEVSEYSSPLQFTVPGGTLPCSYSISPASTSISDDAVSGAMRRPASVSETRPFARVNKERPSRSSNKRI